MQLLKTSTLAVCVLALALGLAVQTQAAPNLTTLHTFTGQSDGTGSFPYAHLILSGSTFYGTTYGGENSEGLVFKVNTNGTSFTILHTFTGGSDGAFPQAGLVLSGSTLYGTTSYGGSGGYGTVFKVNTDGSGFSVLHSFTGGSDGGVPEAGLVLSGSTLYGTTVEGSSGNGTVFKVSTSGSGFTVLHSFTGGSDGAASAADLVLSGNTLYGTTSYGGNSGNGTVFKVGTSGSGFTVLYSFTGGSDGGSPVAGLVLSGSTLYGTTEDGGSGDNGTVFKVNTDGSGFASLHLFNGGDGSEPIAALTLSGSTLYGTTAYGGSGDDGTVFSLSTSGTGFSTLHNFNVSDGSTPVAALTLSGSTLYGTTANGGGADYGTLFKIGTNGSGFATVYNFPFVAFTDGILPHAGLIMSGSMMYGTTQAGGTYGHGTVFQVTINGTLFKTLYSFTGGTDGASPSARLVLSGGTLYGTAEEGGSGSGTVFKINADGSGFATLHIFSGSDGADPPVGLVLSGSTLYGVTIGGGTSNEGTVFKVGTNGSGFKVLHNFTNGTDGSEPFGDLLVSGSTLYGTASSGGNSDSDGTVFKINTDGSGFATLHEFTADSDGAFPNGNLVLSGSTLYGVTSDGGPGGLDNGTAFKVSTSGTGFAVLYTFTGGGDGGEPFAGLVLSGSTLYGTAESGGANDVGTVFSLNINTKALTTLWNFTSGYDGGEPDGQLLLSNGVLYGTTQMGGSDNAGTVFSLPTGP